MVSDTVIYICVAFLTAIIAVLVGFLINCNKKTCSTYAPKDMCICSGMGKKLCSNRDELEASYQNGNTEYRDFTQIQQQGGGPLWKDTNFDKY